MVSSDTAQAETALILSGEDISVMMRHPCNLELYSLQSQNHKSIVPIRSLYPLLHLQQLYIVPSTLACVALVSVSRSEFSRVWAYTDVPSFGAAVAAAAAFSKDSDSDSTKPTDKLN